MTDRAYLFDRAADFERPMDGFRSGSRVAAT